MIDENFHASLKSRGSIDPAAASTAAVAVNLEAPISDEDVDAIDGCDVQIVEETLDEDLPVTEGGVA